MDALQPLVQWMHGDELGPGGLVHEFWEAAEARTAPDRRCARMALARAVRLCSAARPPRQAQGGAGLATPALPCLAQTIYL